MNQEGNLEQVSRRKNNSILDSSKIPLISSKNNINFSGDFGSAMRILTNCPFKLLPTLPNQKGSVFYVVPSSNKARLRIANKTSPLGILQLPAEQTKKK